MFSFRNRIVFIARAPQYSPNSVDKDLAILSAVLQRLRRRFFCRSDIVREDEVAELPQGDVYVTMGRSEAMLNELTRRQQERRILVVNRVQGISWALKRQSQMEYLQCSGIPVPPYWGSDGYWLKRSTGCAESADDVVYVPSLEAMDKVYRSMRERGIHPEVRAHVVGDLVKFYGVRDTGFFRYYYPGDDGDWKFGNEVHNGRPHHYPFNVDSLKGTMNRAAWLTELDVYGGDCIIRPDGSFVLIDLNDWPSFSRCREEAADAIAERIIQRINDEY